ncbi:ATP-binding protein [Flavobacterium sp. 102]|uniref:ATP-binding protein n=1 Tax=Flavobacterium sp. 102 TaxID=2135623 RepID=UPI000EADD682|nr:ATP-binding protein [Flavobacterium sp. 102]RKS03075.1 hypothetical protein C8C84_2816 [Flavobacterium sp. 102]
MEFNISTNIVRDQSKDLNYVVTPNATKIFERIFSSENSANRSFTIIGNYGTGKSTFLWALEKNLLKKKIYFSTKANERYQSYQILKLIGDATSLTFAFQKALGLDTVSSSRDIIDALEKRRVAADKKKNGFVILIDEFGKFLEHINKNKKSNDLYLLQLVSEWANDLDKNAYFIITLHQNFISYSSSLDLVDRQEWEKIKGRFVELLFNEPVEQLLFFASKQLEKISIAATLKKDFASLNDAISKSHLVAFTQSGHGNLTERLYPLDWLSANMLVQSLQRYGQNERSLFSFLNEFEALKDTIANPFFNVTAVYDYLIQTLSSDIQNYSNPHRPQWLSSMRALERAELYFTDDYAVAAEIIKTICLVTIFGKAGGKFDKEFASIYLSLTTSYSSDFIRDSIEKLEQSGIIRFYKHSHKLNFLEGTDIDIEQELTNITKEIDANFSISEELGRLITFPVENAKRHSFLTGTPRYFEYRILNDLNDIRYAEGAIDGYINLIFNSKIKGKDVKRISSESQTNLFVLYKNSDAIYNEIFTINKYKLLLNKFVRDVNALKLLNEELQHHVNKLHWLVLQNLYNDAKENLWFYNGGSRTVQSRKELNSLLSEICDREFGDAPILKNELFNRENLSPQINTARKFLMRKVLEFENDALLGFEVSRFPPEKSIYLSLLKQSTIHREVDGVYQYAPPLEGTFTPLWTTCNAFLASAKSSKRNLGELYEVLKTKPFKLKKGFVEFWIPLFLIIKKEDYALFHETNGFVPYISEDVLDMIHKSAHNYSIKSYDVTGLNINLLEGYKEMVNVSEEGKGTQSTFLSIFGNFLRFYRSLNDYTINTKKLSDKAIKLREAIKTAKDPEDALFNQFPAALGFHSLSIKDDEEVLKNYTLHIQDAIRELRSCYDGLIDRVERTILESIDSKGQDFIAYKNNITNKLRSIDSSLLSTEQGIFFKRVFSPLDDRVSWLKSIADVALGKSIDKMIDEEEVLLMNNIKAFMTGLIKSSAIHEFNKLSSDKLVSFEFVSERGDLIKERIVIDSKVNGAYSGVKKELTEKLIILDTDKRKQLLFELLSLEMNTNL